MMRKKETRTIDLSKAWEKYKAENSSEQIDQKIIPEFSDIAVCEVLVHNNRKYFRRKKKAS